MREPPAASEPSTSGLPTPSLTPSPEIPEIQQARVERTDAQDEDTVDTDVKSIALAPSDKPFLRRGTSPNNKHPLDELEPKPRYQKRWPRF